MRTAILQTAELLVKQHEERAPAKASERAAHLLASGDADGFRAWKEVAVAAKLLVAREEMA